MKTKNTVLAGLFGALTILGSTSIQAASEFAQNVHWTPEKMMEFVDIPQKDHLTTGFIDCMVKHVKDRPYEYCLPGEVKFQDQVVNNLALEYYKSLPAGKKKAFEKQQKEFISYRLTQCSWTDDPNLVNNPKTMTADTKSKLKCLLSATITRKAQLEALTPMNNNGEPE